MAEVRYTAHVLETDDDAIRERLADRYTALRIKGLRQSPDAFSATLEGETALSQREKLTRISLPKKNIIVVVASLATDPDKHWWQHEWVAQATVWGPHTWGEHVSPFRNTHASAEGQQMTEEQTLKTTLSTNTSTTRFFHMTALYVDFDHRKRGLAKLLCDRAFQRIVETTRDNADQAELRIIIKPTNTVVVRMYEQMGFRACSEVQSTLAEATFAAGDQTSLPQGYDELPLYTTRKGLIMVKDIPIK